jgi:hypothetical protein
VTRDPQEPREDGGCRVTEDYRQERHIEAAYSDDNPRKSRPEYSHDLDAARAQGHRVGHQLVRNDAGYHGATGRLVKRHGKSLEEGEAIDVPEVYPATEDQGGEHGAEAEHSDLRSQQNGPSVEAIGDYSGEDAEDDSGQRSGRHHQTKVDRGPGEL